MMIKNNQNKYLSFAKKQFSKFVIVLVVISMFTNIFTINKASAYFNDEATIEGNTFTAGTLEISLDNTNTFSSGLQYPTDSISTSMDISNTGNLDSQYIAKTIPIGSDNSACNYISMTASNGAYTYTGLINDFISDTIPTTSTTWNYNFTVSPTAPSSIWGKTCYFSWSYTAWQNNLPDASSGFTSTLEKSGAIKIGKTVVLNEVLYNPKSTDPVPSNKEFIELYNNSNTAIDIASWQVSEISSSTEHKYTITTTVGTNTAVPYSGSTIISPKGWMTLMLSDSTALNNTGDTIRLYDTSNNKLDEYTYTGGKPTGFSDARIPDGIGAWVDPIPTPGESNELVIDTEQPIVKSIAPETQSIIIDKDSITTDDIKEPVILDTKIIDTTTDQTLITENKEEQDATSADQEVDRVVDDKEVIETKITTEPEEVYPTKAETTYEESKKDELAEADKERQQAETSVTATQPVVVEVPVIE